MRVFLSWSGARSHALAKALHDWLPSVLQAVEPWMSSEDIQKGSRWLQEIGSRLADTDFGIICVTPENRTAPWLTFEAGALSKSIEHSAVATVLLDLTSTDVTGPLAQFQDTKIEKEDVRRLLDALNRRLPGRLPDHKLSEAHDLWWPKLQLAAENARTLVDTRPVPRKDRDVLEEILSRVREQGRETAATPISTPEWGVPRWFEEYARATAIDPEPTGASSGIVIREDCASTAMRIVGGLTCPVHGHAITASVLDPLAETVQLNVVTCCMFAVMIARDHIKWFVTGR